MTLDEFVGIPWRDKGRDRDGCDCWGLIVLVYRERRKIDLPHFHDDYVTAADNRAITRLLAHHSEPFEEITERDVQPLDVVMMLDGGKERHIGLVARRGFVLHVGMELGASRIESYRSIRLKNRVSRFLRMIDNARSDAVEEMRRRFDH
jgi:cell wall-associated NlpC family hydrolase